MNRKEQADIPERLKYLRKIPAPANFEALLDRQIRTLRPRNRFIGMLMHPVPAIVIVAGCAFAMAYFFAFPLFFGPSSPLPENGPVTLPTEHRTVQAPGTPAPPRPRTVADSLSADTASIRGNDVNTSKLP